MNTKEIVAKKIDGVIYPLSENIISEKYEYIYSTDEIGWNILRRGLTFIMLVACKKICADADIKVMHSMNKGLYCKVLSEKIFTVTEIKSKMLELIKKDLIFKNIRMPKKEALAFLEKQNVHKDKYYLFAHRKGGDIVELNELDGVIDYFYGVLPHSTSACSVFDLKPVENKENNFILLPCDRTNPSKVLAIQNVDKISNVFEERKHWAEISGINLLSDLNKVVVDGNQKDIIEITEALHERKIADIAKEVVESKKRVVLIAGPSSSGKTTFCHRLAIQLRTHGLKPKTISVDDYFRDNRTLPVMEDGLPDFEDINTIDLPLLNKDLKSLLNGEEIECPTFNFHEGKPEYKGHKMQLFENEILMLEGIHALNPEMTSGVEEKDKFYIYISALTQVNLDNHNRISTTDLRFCRRLIRDFYYRGASPEATFALWKNVRKGERKNIFPYQEKGECVFNSELSYEINVLKKFAVPLLEQINKEEHPEFYPKAQELLDMFSYVKTLDDLSYIPPNSILKEFLPKE